MTPRLAGRRILIVDDEPMIALLLETALADEDCTIVGPFSGVAAARSAAEGEALDFALLDVNVADGKVYPIADILDGRGVRFLLLSGYGDGDSAACKPHWQTAAKPFSIEPLIERICTALAAA
jgi:DNA-binding NtrC family response regulator